MLKKQSEENERTLLDGWNCLVLLTLSHDTHHNQQQKNTLSGMVPPCWPLATRELPDKLVLTQKR